MPDQQPKPRPSDPEPDLVVPVCPWPAMSDSAEAPGPGTAAGQASACAARVLSTFESVVRAAESEEVRVVERACRRDAIRMTRLEQDGSGLPCTPSGLPQVLDRPACGVAPGFDPDGAPDRSSPLVGLGESPKVPSAQVPQR